ncbi:MAG: bifunctional proline dehydrogenase/L-glutamate gamma-semialdehyde dehydrogenase PutA [Gammaproteobacteria bacterium]|nr:bifunctional proline dehydrogenase/L-glutamate gamma-semialdehyde dehydrogenase PutA [Gammaproteobacteria bacterium]
MTSLSDISRKREKINKYYLSDESLCISGLLKSIDISPDDLQKIESGARDLVTVARQNKSSQGTIEAFIREYSLSSEEGIILMCLAEALLRIPDDITADRLIKSKLALAEFQTHIGNSHSLFVNASTWGLMLTGKLVNVREVSTLSDQFVKLIGRMGEPVIRGVLRQAMKIMASQYVMGENIDSALQRGAKEFDENYRFSYDMLGESALSKVDASRYFKAYKHSIEIISRSISTGNYTEAVAAPSISIKLSALHPRYEISQHERVMSELMPDVLSLVQFACEKNVAVTLDAEEADRLDLSLEIFEKLICDKSLDGWNGLGIAVQAYQKRAMHVLDWLGVVAKKTGKIIPVRLVKGAYWDTEIKRAQEQGLSGYPVFTRKSSTDVSYIACAKFMLNNGDCFYPQFATHNAHTIAAIRQLAGDRSTFEFQRLHGMGENLHDQIIKNCPCRIYCPVGVHRDLLPYLVRRLLENGANSSFVSRIESDDVPIEQIVRSPMDLLANLDVFTNPNILLPNDIFENRNNSFGLNLGERCVLDRIKDEIDLYKNHFWFSDSKSNESREIRNPADKDFIVGYINDDLRDSLKATLSVIDSSKKNWQRTSVKSRIGIIQSFSKLLQDNCVELYALCVYEAGKTINDAVAEIREAIDFCEYYILQAKTVLDNPVKLEGPVGEDNFLSYHGRGLFVCISPWNFPVAIFVGQIVAALITGNTVIAKCSSNTSIVSKRLIEFLYQAGLPKNVLTLVNCAGRLFNEVVLSDERVCGVAFTGSFGTAQKINVTLAARRSPIVPLIAETGGLNAMIVDSSALPEQVVKDVINSAFLSSGQRCSALRVLIVQRDILPRVQDLLINAMCELIVGDPVKYSSDVPPVIDRGAMESLNNYKEIFKNKNKLLHEIEIPEGIKNKGYYVAPALVEIESLADLDKEQFGPILHIMTFEANGLDELIDNINAMGYGLTLGIHSRIDGTISKITSKANVGNIYVNRNMVGAVVGVQPFGGEGYSGTGPKAGGPNYLQRFCTEKTITTNTSAIGGNTDLLSMNES